MAKRYLSFSFFLFTLSYDQISIHFLPKEAF